MTRRLVIVVVVVAVVLTSAIAVTKQFGHSSPSSSTTQAASSTATVKRMDLAETTPVSGTVGYASASTIVQPAGMGSQAITQAQQSVAQAQGNITADEQELQDTNAADAQTSAQAQQALATAQATLTSDTTQLQADQTVLAAAEQSEANDCQGAGESTTCASESAQVNTDQQKVTSDEQKVSSDQTAVQSARAQVTSAAEKQTQGDDQGQAKVVADQLTLTNARSALSAAEAAATAYDQTSKYTALPAVGQVINAGQPLWSVDGRPVPLLAGALIAWRAFTAGMSPGSDVAALDQALIDVGQGGGLTVSDVFSDATAAAITRFQASLGQPQTGSLALGAAVFEPTAVRVTAVHPLVGSSVSGGQPVLDVTSTTPVVNVALPVDRTYLIKVGDPVSVNLPDGTTGQGTITAVGTVATNTTPSNSGNNNTSATVNVTVSMTKTSAAGSLDQAPVMVNITSSSVHQVLAVPTTTLLALSGGGYALEVAKPDGSHQLVDVTTGIFDDQSGMVQVSGAGLSAGQQVVMAT